MKNSQTQEEKYEVALNEIAYLRKPMQRLLERIKNFYFITPNLLTLFSFLCALLASLMFLTPGFSYVASAAFFIICSYLFDCADGRLARLKGIETTFGFWLDRITDQLKVSLLILCLGIRAYITAAPATILVATALTIMLQLLKEFNWALFEIFLLKEGIKKEYSQFVLDNLGIKFNKDNLFKRVQFQIVRIFIFLPYAQMFTLAFCPLAFGPKIAIYLYGIISLISLGAKIIVYFRIFSQTDAQKTASHNLSRR
jgi:hypothetical protein